MKAERSLGKALSGSLRVLSRDGLQHVMTSMGQTLGQVHPVGGKLL